jgi:hypothetical protein
MTANLKIFARKAALLGAGVLLLTPLAAIAQTGASATSSNQATSSSQGERWLHVRVVSNDAKGETVRVNVPLELAEKVLPAINKDRLQHGKVKIDNIHANDVDLHALVDAIRTAKDGEYVTVQGTDQEVRVAKQAGHLIVHVRNHEGKAKGKEDQVEVKVPMTVVNALFSAGKDELDLVAALHALAANGDTELVSVKSDENTVHVWLDSKNLSN